MSTARFSYQSPLLVCLGSLLAFLAMSTQLPVPFLDKIALVLFTALVLIRSGGLSNRYLINLLLLSLLFLLSLLSSLLYNLGAVTKDAFILFLYLNATVLIISVKNPGYFLRCIRYALMGTVFSGLVFFLYSWAVRQPLFVTPMWGKGLPDVYAASGFNTTPQVFGTYCTILAALSFGTTASAGARPSSTAFAAIGVLSSLNRVWYLYWSFLFFRRHKYWLLAVLLLTAAAAYWLKIVDLSMFVVLQTLSSRIEMFTAILTLYLRQDLLVLLAGDLFYNGSYLSLHGKNISYVENGQLFLLAKLGLLGIMVYLACVMHILNKTWRRRREFFPLACYYLVLAQAMTHEFLSFSFWLFIMLLLCELNAARVPGYAAGAGRSTSTQGTAIDY